jgi:hypothetical protein
MGINIGVLLSTYSKPKRKSMKDFATTSIAALLMAGLYALGSGSTHHKKKKKTYPGPVTETVPNKTMR